MPAKKHLDLLDLKSDMEFIKTTIDELDSDSYSAETDQKLSDIYHRIEAINDNLIEMGIGDE